MKYKTFVVYSIISFVLVLTVFYVTSKNLYMSQRFENIKKEFESVVNSIDSVTRQLVSSMENILNSADIQQAIEDYLLRKLSAEGLKKYLALKIADNSLIFNNLIGAILSYENKVILELGETSFVRKTLRKTNEVDVDVFRDRDRVFMVLSIPTRIENMEIVTIGLFDISNLTDALSNEVYINSSFDFYDTKPKHSRYSYIQYIPSAFEYVKFDLNSTFLVSGFLKYFFIFIIPLILLLLSNDVMAYFLVKKTDNLISKNNESCEKISSEFAVLKNRFETLNRLIVDIVSEKSSWNTFCKDLSEYLNGMITFIGFLNNDKLELLGSFDTRKNSNLSITEFSLKFMNDATLNNNTILVEVGQLPNFNFISKMLDINEKNVLYVVPILLEDKVIGIVSVVYDRIENITEESKVFLTNIVQLIDEKVRRVLDLKESKKGDKLNIDQELLKMAMFDQLTKIPNRRYLELKLKSFYKSYKTSGKRFGLIFFDIDNFKKFNDEYGHDCGDMVLKTVGKTLKGVFRPDDVFGRWGGEEFLVIVANVDEKAVFSSAERFRKIIESSFVDCANRKLRITVSIGATVIKDEDTIEDILKRVDDLMYQAKQKGKNMVVLG